MSKQQTDPAPLTKPDPVQIPEEAARRVLDGVMDSLRWAREWRENAQAESGPQSGDAAAEDRWAWYCQGAEAAARHDRDCVEEEARRVLGLPPVETDAPQPVSDLYQPE